MGDRQGSTESLCLDLGENDWMGVRDHLLSPNGLPLVLFDLRGSGLADS